MTEAWTVYVEAGGLSVTGDEVARVADLLEKDFPGAAMAPAPVLGCRFRLDDEPLPTRALGAVQGMFELAARQALRTRLAAEDREARVTRVEMSQGAEAGWVPRGLATANGLAARLGVGPAWVRMLMKRKGAPDPVDIEGGSREIVYDTEAAMKYLRRVTGNA